MGLRSYLRGDKILSSSTGESRSLPDENQLPLLGTYVASPS